MTAIGMSTGRVARSRRLSLSEALGTHGIQTMPRAWADEHKSAFLKESRASGYGPRTVTLLSCVRWLLLATSLAFVAEHFSREGRLSMRTMVLGYLSFVMSLFLIGLALGYFVHPLLWLMTVPGIMSIPAVGFEMLRHGDEKSRFNISTTWWMSERLMPDDSLYYVPARLRERTERVMLIPGVRVYKEELGDDPLIYAARGWGPFKEISYLGGYATGVDRIDTF